MKLDCVLACDSWDGAVVLPATDVSNEGLWVETPYALQPGEELVVSFGLPGSDETRVWAIAEVARVGMWRRREDAYPAGMGLVFTYCSERDRMRLRAALHGRPPRLPAGEHRDASSPKEQTETRVDPPLPAVLDWLLASE